MIGADRHTNGPEVDVQQLNLIAGELTGIASAVAALAQEGRAAPNQLEAVAIAVARAAAEIDRLLYLLGGDDPPGLPVVSRCWREYDA